MSHPSRRSALRTATVRTVATALVTAAPALAHVTAPPGPDGTVPSDRRTR